MKTTSLKGNFHVSLMLSIFCLLNLSNKMMAQTIHGDSLWTLNDIPNWIYENIKFPNDAYKYGIAGVEQFVISATWDGRVFITSGLNTLNPAFEEEIKHVVSKAPKCRFAGATLEDIYKLVKIDFTNYIPIDSTIKMQCIKRHLPPCFALRGQKMQRLNSREQFVKWLSSKFRLSRDVNLGNYVDTVSLCYNISKEGNIENVSVKKCSNNIIKAELIRIMKHSPSWKPAITDGKVLISVSIKDEIVINVNEKGEILPFEIYTDEVFQNSKTVPFDPDMLILNPEVQLQYAGSHKSLMNAIHDSLVVDKRVKFVGSFIVERNGEVSNVCTEATDINADSVIKKMINQSKWIPAKQGGKAVRSIYTFAGVQLPQTKYINVPPFNKSLSKRWDYFKKAYPEVDAVINGYDKFKYLNRSDYEESLLMRGFPLINQQKRAVRK